MTAAITSSDIALRLVLAFVAGLLIGIDRGEHAHPAGPRTTVLVCVAAALAMLQANLLLAHTAQTNVAASIIRLDFMRLPLGVLSGIGFIGAGAILQRGERVRGVTTAATIWLVTIIGLCFGGGQLGLGVAGTGIGLMTLWLLRYAEAATASGHRGKVAIRFQPSDLQEEDLLTVLRARGFRMKFRRLVQDSESGHMLECTGLYRGAYPDWSSRVTKELARMPGVTCVDWLDIE